VNHKKAATAKSESPRVVVFGYHDIGVVCLQELLGRGSNVVAVVTHRDDPAEAIWFGSVAGLAAAHKIPSYTPGDPNTPEFVEEIRRLRPDLIFSFYYRRLLCAPTLAIPRLGAINLHGSLLPKYRGRAPLNWVLIHGETITGVTLHYMDALADHGDIIAQRTVPIVIEDTALTLSRKLAAEARMLLAETYPLILTGRAPRIPQDHAGATTFARRTPADGLIDWSRSAWEIYNLIRAVTRPFPGAFTFLGDRRVILWRARPPRVRPAPAPPGTIVGIVEAGVLAVATGDGILEVTAIQAEGALEMDGTEFLAVVEESSPAARPRFGPPATTDYRTTDH
jgi:methionyl-tRNA formyltransferase